MKILKILKKAQQKNVIFNKDYYNIYEINSLLSQHIIFYLGDDFEACYNNIEYNMLDEIVFRLFTNDLNEIKVELDQYNYFTTVAVHKNGNKYKVII